MGPAEPRPGPVAALIAWSAGQPWLTALLVAALTLLGAAALRETPLDAIPDLSEPQVVIFTDWPGRSPQLVEDQVTYPVSAALLGSAGVVAVRGQSMFGMSFVTVIFDEHIDLGRARSAALERLFRLELPEGARAELGPEASGVGWVFQYALVDRSGQLGLHQLRALQDWTLRYALQEVPGVAEVASVGGFVEEWQVQLDPERLVATGASVMDVARAVRASNQDAGGASIELAGHEVLVRGRGYLRGLDDLGATVVRPDPAGGALRVRDLGQVSRGPGPRRGFAELDGEGEVVGGIVVMRQGEDALTVIDGVKAKLATQALPPGVEVVITYDRSELIHRAVDTLRRTLVEEMLVVALIIGVFLMHARSALVAVITLPAAVLLAFLPMWAMGLGANLMSLGGIAVAIGAMVDASIILIENVHKRLEDWAAAGRPGPRSAAVLGAMQEVGPSVFFSLLVLTASFLPVFSLEATEGRLFRPLAWTKTWAMAFGALLAVTLTPALIALLVRGEVRPEGHNPLNRLLVRVYTPVVRACVHHRWGVVGLAAAAVLGTLPVLAKLPSEFMPPLHEGSLLYMPTAPPGMGMTEAGVAMQHMGRQLRAVPEVERVFGKMGRALTATDPAPMGMAETTVLLKPEAEWRRGLTWPDLMRELDAAVQVPGMPNLWWMPVQTRTEMLSTGVRSPVALMVQGPDLARVEQAALALEARLRGVPGTRSAVAERSTGGLYLDADVDREAAARHGLSVEDVQMAIETAVGGAPVTTALDGRARIPVTLRLARERREGLPELARLPLMGAGGHPVPLGEVARLTHAEGPPMLRSQGGALVGYVFVDPGEQPVGAWVDAAEQALRGLELPAGVRRAWVGQHEHLQRAKERLLLVLPLTLGLVVLLLYLNTRSLAETAIVLLAVPFSLVGAVWLLWALDFHLSVAVAVGFIALAGLDAETGVVMLLYLRIAHAERLAQGRLTSPDELTEAIVEGAARRVRPKMMTVLTTLIGLVPLLWATGTGADLMQRLAAPMVGGLATSFLLELTVYPAIFALWKGRALSRPSPPASASS